METDCEYTSCFFKVDLRCIKNIEGCVKYKPSTIIKVITGYKPIQEKYSIYFFVLEEMYTEINMMDSVYQLNLLAKQKVITMYVYKWYEQHQPSYRHNVKLNNLITNIELIL